MSITYTLYFLRRGGIRTTGKLLIEGQGAAPDRLAPAPKWEGKILERQDVCRLFDLLEQLYQGKKKPRDKVTLAIWAEVLKPWSYEQVRSAVVQRARENRFFPDPSELAAYLPALELGDPKAGQEISEDVTHDLHWEQQKLWVEWHMLWKQSLVELGLETIPDEVWDEFPGKLITPQEWAGQKAGV